ncbi:MAG: DinB family protein [Pyrinomonadaceae bacterium]
MNEISLINEQLEQAFRKSSWHGPNLMGAIKGVSPDVAAFRTSEKRNSIHELILHCAYWKYTVLRNVLDLPKGSFPLEGSHVLPRPEMVSPKELKGDIALLKDTHARLIEAVSGFRAKRLDECPKGGKTTFRDLFLGVAAHDLYHAGQITLLKRTAQDLGVGGK